MRWYQSCRYSLQSIERCCPLSPTMLGVQTLAERMCCVLLCLWIYECSVARTPSRRTLFLRGPPSSSTPAHLEGHPEALEQQGEHGQAQAEHQAAARGQHTQGNRLKWCSRRDTSGYHPFVRVMKSWTRITRCISGFYYDILLLNCQYLVGLAFLLLPHRGRSLKFQAFILKPTV